MGAIVLAELERERTLRRPRAGLPTSTSRDGPIEATTVEADEVPLAIDELPLVALLGCFAEGETVVRGAGELRVKESDRIATVVDGLRGLGGRDRGAPRRVRRPRHRRLCAAGGSTPRATTGWRCSAPSPAWPREEGVEVVGMEAADVSYPGFADDIAGARVLMVVAIDGPAGAGKSTVARAVADRARVHLPRLRRDVPQRRAGRERARRRAGLIAESTHDRSSATGCCSTGAT